MRRASILFALLLGSSNAFAQDPLDALMRDAQQLAQCHLALDSPCVIALSDIPSYQKLSTPVITAAEWVKAQKHFYDAMRNHSWRYTRFDVTAPTEVFRDGTRLYAFAPYSGESTFGGSLNSHHGVLIALSVDGGATWKFVGWDNWTPEKIRLIVPSYSNQPLPRTGEVTPSR